MKSMLERLSFLQADIQKLGMARFVLADTSSAISDLDIDDSVADATHLVFKKFVTDPEIVDATRDLFLSGHYNVSVSNAVKAIDVYIKKRLSIHNKSGTALMNEVFSNNNPKLIWSARNTQSEKDAHEGYRFLFTGVMLGLRNPTTHEFGWVDTADDALECILLAQHLLRKAKEASEITLPA